MTPLFTALINSDIQAAGQPWLDLCAYKNNNASSEIHTLF